MRAALALLVCAGCDQVFGLDEAERACPSASFAQARTVDLVAADDFSIAWDQSRAVVVANGLAYELALPGAVLTPIDIGPYVPVSLALSPEGDSMLFSADVEPPVLYAAVRGTAEAWRIDPNVPVGTFAGTPSADAFGPRRVIVRMRETGPVQEYEDDNGLWNPVGGLHDFDGLFSANLSPDGLTMVYAGHQADGTGAIFQATRTTTAAWFGMPTVILAGDHADPQLLGRCHSLYVIDPAIDQNPNMLRRYDL